MSDKQPLKLLSVPLSLVYDPETTAWKLSTASDDVVEAIVTSKPSGTQDASTDAFGRARVSEPFNLIDTTHQYNLAPLYWESSPTGSSTHLPNESSVLMSISTGTGLQVFRQTKQYIRYQPLKSQEVAETFVFGAAKANLRRRVGLFDAQNGVYFEQDGTNGLYMVIRSYATGAVVEERVPQTLWNLDRMDGTGSSGVTLNVSRAQIFTADIEWLGVGTVRVGFVIGRSKVYVHAFNHANEPNNTSVYMTTANLPIRYELYNVTGTASASTMKQICSAVQSEGGREENGAVFSVSNRNTLRAVSNSYLPILAMRVAKFFPGSDTTGIVNRGIYRPLDYEIYSEDAPAYYEVVQGADVTGGTWLPVDGTHSGMLYNVTATGTVGGIVVDSGYIGTSATARVVASNEADTDIPLVLNVAGTVGDTICIRAIRTTNTNTDMGAKIREKELY